MTKKFVIRVVFVVLLTALGFLVSHAYGYFYSPLQIVTYPEISEFLIKESSEMGMRVTLAASFPKSCSTKKVAFEIVGIDPSNSMIHTDRRVLVDFSKSNFEELNDRDPCLAIASGNFFLRDGMVALNILPREITIMWDKVDYVLELQRDLYQNPTYLEGYFPQTCDGSVVFFIRGSEESYAQVSIENYTGTINWDEICHNKGNLKLFGWQTGPDDKSDPTSGLYFRYSIRSDEGELAAIRLMNY